MTIEDPSVAAAAPPKASEDELRRRLGIPEHARRVLVLTETSHWDPDWLLTSEGYFGLRVRRNLRQAIDGLLADPRRVYSVECVFFLRMFYERMPAYRAHIRRLVNEARLRLMGSGVTTPDTIIPSAELLIRDYLLGQEWLRANGMTQEPEVAFFPDTFGFTPGLPEVLGAVGVSRAAICRIDGMYFFGNETEPASAFPRSGSSAELLLNRERSLDFVWRGPDGAELLCHWLAFTYGQGELLAHAGITRQAGAPLAVPWRTDHHVAAMVERYVGQLAPVSRTPYLLCPIGFDFSAPIARLVDLLDRYNERHAPTTGTWVVNAGLDDYLALVDQHRRDLPVVNLDPSQYFTGFFTSRPTLKERYTDLTDALVLADRLALDPSAPRRGPDARQRLVDAWWTAATANHHDFVTGTAPDRVVRREQLPWLDDALVAARAELDRVAAEWRIDAGPTSGETPTTPPPPTIVGGNEPIIEIDTPTMRLRFDRAQGGALVAATTPDGTPLVGPGPTFDVVASLDSGGLWRMGHEYRGGRFEAVDRLGARPAEVSIRRHRDGSIELSSTGVLDGLPARRTVSIDPDRSVIRLRLETTLADRRVATVTVALPGPVPMMVTDVPGGVTTRPSRARFDPAFWPAQSFVHLPGPDNGSVAVLLGRPGAVAVTDADVDHPIAQVIAARNATKEVAYRLVPLPAQPARGHDAGPHVFHLALAFVGPGDWRAADLPAAARAERRRARSSNRDQRLAERADGIIQTDRPDVVATAAKPAHRGNGAVVRLTSTALGPTTATVRWVGVPLRAAAICDGRERDLADLSPDGDGVTLVVPRGISSLRLVPGR